MTNYPVEFAASWHKLPIRRAIRQFRMALSMMTWNPARWATQHNLCVDLPSAWWLAGHAIELQNEVMEIE